MQSAKDELRYEIDSRISVIRMKGRFTTGISDRYINERLKSKVHRRVPHLDALFGSDC